MLPFSVLLQQFESLGQLKSVSPKRAHMLYTMRSRILFQKIAAFLLLAVFVSPIFAQKAIAPRQEKLLNGAKLLMWPDPSAKIAYVKVRVHSGTSFDPQGKEGVMMMLAESFFPNETSKEFFREELGGTLGIGANYDFIQVSATAKPEEFLSMLETVATAIANPTIDKETTAKLKNKRIEDLKQMNGDPMHIADWATSKQLFGTFPYGRPEHGTIESVSKIEFADLIDARQRFLTSDNATISIGGNFDPALAFRAARRYFGSWLKSDKLIPSTFKQPDEPTTKTAKLLFSNEGSPHVRFALRGVARNDKDYAASKMFSFILESRVKENATAANATFSFVGNEAHILPGSFVVGISSPDNEQIPANLVTLLLSKPVTAEEFNAAKTRALTERKAFNIDEFWLDADTYKLASAADEQRSFDNVVQADVQRVADRLAKNPVVSASVTKAEKSATN